ncbi:hypothetical protein [Paracidovorax valerianellae]|uniref:Uncharacterized protein n=1 Tax=Paracidovorax valerianellae TaxID=187868 RepID=A0A1G7EA87_9BURK|nr:hypothetical protein [Paracidovorax valerianellae]MDA8447415.1 hypothetical protein [Paracidovorax valerianellae]SDE60557.1 hypothetical protein SAMN05192589_12240 [Paracidovorax valerianellae]
MNTESLAENPVATDAPPAGNAADAPPLFDERALLAHYVLRDFEQAVANVEQELRDAEPAPDAQAESPATEDDLNAMAEERRALARQIVTGAWLNRNNPQWDPLEPETHRPDPNDPLLAILQSVQEPAD